MGPAALALCSFGAFRKTGSRRGRHGLPELFVHEGIDQCGDATGTAADRGFASTERMSTRTAHRHFEVLQFSLPFGCEKGQGATEPRPSQSRRLRQLATFLCDEVGAVDSKEPVPLHDEGAGLRDGEEDIEVEQKRPTTGSWRESLDADEF